MFLSSVAGVAFDRHMIRDVHDRVLEYVHPSPDFELPHNQPITWDQMLRQTSGWIGTMWGKPWWADRPGKIRGMNLRPALHRSASNGNTQTFG